jgi:hypothetical protein
MDLFIKNLMQNLHGVKEQVTYDEYYRLLEKIMMVCNIELQEKDILIEHNEDGEVAQLVDAPDLESEK